MSSSICTQTEAKQVIQNIRDSRNVDRPGGLQNDANAEDLATALELLSDQLYNKPTHFILELIQNADDNVYPDNASPYLTLTYREDGYLWVGCNEIGFNEKNVQAICKIGKSTKKNDGSRKGYIGEKGIGFKAVFKVADVVWVHSGPFQFQFRRDDTLGMVVPRWPDEEEEPSPTTSNTMFCNTLFCLRIPVADDRELVKSHLVELEADLLLFLRKLSKINIKIYKDEESETSPSYSHSIECIKDTEIPGFSKLVRDDTAPVCNSRQNDIYTSTTTWLNLPSDQKREGIMETDITLGFPRGPTQLRAIHNFLPIRDYGLPFLIQADFILTANRGDIVEDNQWNQHLVACAIKAFIIAVEEFNSLGIHKYEWPQFLYHSRPELARGTIMKQYSALLRQSLWEKEAIETQYGSGNYGKPSSLRLVPKEFTDGGTPPKPLLRGPQYLCSSVSMKYNAVHVHSLGVPYQTKKELRGGLRDMGSALLAIQPHHWHSRLAAAVVRSGASYFEELPLIPLRGGGWVRGDAGPIYFPNTEEDVVVPEGIDVKIVDEIACSDSSRRTMFSQFGVRQLTAQKICGEILKLHRPRKSLGPRLSVESLIYHAWYLFVHQGAGRACDDIQLATEKPNQCARGRSLYMSKTGGSFCMKEYFSKFDAPCTFLYPGYLTYTNSSAKSNWLDWLENRVGVSTLPKLQSNTGGLSPEFRYLIDNHAAEVWLRLLRDNWTHYCDSVTSVARFLGKIQVGCIQGTKFSLCDTYLSTSSVLKEPLALRHAPIFELPDPMHSGWRNLQVLGLYQLPDIRFYVLILQSIASTPPRNHNHTEIIRLYQAISLHCHEDPSMVQSSFKTQSLIGLNELDPDNWLSMAKCRWKAPPCLKDVVALKNYFPTLSHFFRSQLQILDAGPCDVLDELLCIDPVFHEDREQIKTLIRTLPHYKQKLNQPNVKERFEQLKYTFVLPVTRSTDEADYKTSICDDWFIIDRERLSKLFLGRIWTLEFNTADIVSLERVFENLGVGGRKLSQHVQEETMTGAEAEEAFIPEVTQKLQAKAPFISMLVPKARRQTVTKRLESIQVWSCAKLLLRRYVVVNEIRIYGEDETGRVLLKEAGKELRLYCTETASTKGLPWQFVSNRLAEYLGITDDKHKNLLSNLLPEIDHEVIKDSLERENLLEPTLLNGTSIVVELKEAIDTNDSDAEDASTDDSDMEYSGKDEFGDYFDSDDSDANEEPRMPDTGRAPERTTPSTLPPVTRSASLAANPAYSTPLRVQRHSPVPPGNGIIDIRDILSDAENHDTSTVHIVGSASRSPIGEPNQTGPSLETPSFNSSSARRSSASPSFSNSHIGAYQSPRQRSPFDMSAMISALSNNTPSRLPDPFQTSTGGVEQDIGFGGELFIYGILQREIQADEDCWTSKMRFHHGLSKFHGNERDYSDFTLEDPETGRRFANWLVQRSYETAQQWRGRNITYHLEAKTTLGGLTEPFVWSNNQMRLARDWHISPSDVYMVLRVYHLRSDPTFKIYVDPFALMEDGELVFTAQGGYCVQPA